MGEHGHGQAEEEEDERHHEPPSYDESYSSPPPQGEGVGEGVGEGGSSGTGGGPHIGQTDASMSVSESGPNDDAAGSSSTSGMRASTPPVMIDDEGGGAPCSPSMSMMVPGPGESAAASPVMMLDEDEDVIAHLKRASQEADERQVIPLTNWKEKVIKGLRVFTHKVTKAVMLEDKMCSALEKCVNERRMAPYTNSTFAVNDWLRIDVCGKTFFINKRWEHAFPGYVMPLESFVETRKMYAQFGQRYVFMRCEQGKMKSRLAIVRLCSLPVCEDAVATTENMISVFDGVGETQYWGGSFARVLARSAAKRSMVYCPKGNFGNRSTQILKQCTADASDYVHDSMNKPELKDRYKELNAKGEARIPTDGRSTALVLSIVEQKLHACIHGDCQYALLRIGHGGYECVHISQPLYYEDEPARKVPKQLWPNLHLDPNFTPYTEEMGVLHDDIIVAGSDGFWDNVPSEWGENNLRGELARFADRTSRAQRPSAQPFVTALGNALVEMAKKRMLQGGKPDDLSLVVACISMNGDYRGGHTGVVHGHTCNPCKDLIQTEQGHDFYLRSEPDKGLKD